MAGRMWLANANYGAWVPCPSIEMPSGTQKWGATGQFLNGGAYVRRSITGARVYEMNWPMKHQADLDTVEAFFEGAYGEGPFYVVEPGSMQYNMFPAYLATPGMGVSDGPTLLYDKRPTVAQYTGSSGEPIRGAAYLKQQDDLVNRYTVAIPEGYTLHTSIEGTAGAIMATNMDGSPASPGSPAVTYEWTDEQDKSPSTMSVEGEVVRTNYVVTPRPYDGATEGWTGVGEGVDTDGPTGTTGAYRITGNDSAAIVGLVVPLEADEQPVYISFQVRSSVEIPIALTGLGSATEPETLITDEWTEVTFEAYAIESVSQVAAQIVTYDGEGMVPLPEGETLDITMAYVSTDSGDYFDGDTEDIPSVPGGLAHGIRQWEGDRLIRFHLDPDYIGTAVVYSMCAVAVPGSETFDIEAHVNSGRFPRGKGSAGMEVDGDFERTSYSAALDRYHGSVRLVEVEPWL